LGLRSRSAEMVRKPSEEECFTDLTVAWEIRQSRRLFARLSELISVFSVTHRTGSLHSQTWTYAPANFFQCFSAARDDGQMRCRI